MDKFVKSSTMGETPKRPKKEKVVEAEPWVEKYRPRKVTEVSAQAEVVAVLHKCITEQADMPNFLLYGPAGVGKTSIILAAARELFGPSYRDRILELNASDERGIQVVRDKVKTFARVAVSNRRADGRPCPAFKLVILDEADSMTGPAQAALRRTMETASRTTRFCLICNYISRIIEPLASRCAKFRFKPLPHDIQLERLTYIAERESVRVSSSCLSRMVDLSEGDMRRSITLLQTAHRYTPEIDADVIDELAGVIPVDAVDRALLAVQGSHDKVALVIETLDRDGYCGQQLLLQLYDRVLVDDRLPCAQKANALATIALCESRLVDGAHERIQLFHVLTQVAKEFRDARRLKK